MKAKIIAACMGIFCLFKANAQTVQQIVDLSTGVVNGSSTLITPPGSDDTWQVKIPASSTYQPVPCTNGTLYEMSTGMTYSGTWSTDPHARWLSPYITGSAAAVDLGPAGDYLYQMSFTASSSCTPVSAVLTLNKLGGDNIVSAIKVNGTSYPLALSFNPVLGTTITLGPGVILPGALNTITITVHNDAEPDYPTFTGLFVYGNLTITYPIITADITGPASICSGNPITVNGTGTGAIVRHVWTVVESDAAGVAVGGGVTEWWSPFITGNPGAYTLPAAGAGGPTLTCGKYYRIKLAVQNDCIAWIEDFIVIRINCTPAANAGLDKTICEGSCTTIGAGKSGIGIYYHWTTTVGGTVVSAGTGKPITVCPTATTTYTLTATDNLTECAATDVVTVTVLQPTHATFGYSDDPTPLTYYTVTVTPTYPGEASQPGWGDTWVIEERDPANPSTVLSSTLSGSNPNPICWWSYGAPHSFQGFNGTINVNCTSGPSIGQFLYGHYYMIIRTTWNVACGWSQSSFPSYRATRSADAPAINGISTATNASEFVDIAAGIAASDKETNLNVHPNPSNGIFTIELNNSTKTTNMEIYDILGNKVKEAQVAGNCQLDLTGYAKGIYMIRMIVNDKAVMKKIIVE